VDNTYDYVIIESVQWGSYKDFIGEGYELLSTDSFCYVLSRIYKL